MRIGINAMILSERDTGVGVWTRGLIRALDALEAPDEYLVYHGKDAGQLPPLSSGRARYVRLPVHNRLRVERILYEQALLPARLRRDGVDVLHCPAYVCPVRARMPVVLTLHDLFALTHPGLCKRLNVLHYRLMLPRSVRRAAVLHCTSKFVRESVAERFPSAAGRAHVITPGVDGIFVPGTDPSERAATLKRLGLSEPPFLFVGSIEPKKNVGLLLDACLLAMERYGVARKLLMVGGDGWRSGPLLARIRDLGRRGVVMRAGYVRRDRLPAIYRAAEALVFPSLVEGFGIPPLEAMACGTPVICADAAGLKEGAADAALMCPSGDADAFARAMRDVAGSPELRRDLAQAGLRRVEQFRWRDRAPAFQKLYRLAVAAGRP